MDFSIRERKLIIEIALDTVIALYYFISVYQLSGWDEITGSEMGRIIRNSIAFAIVGSIALNLLFIRNAKEEAKDERDYLIEVRGSTFGYYTLFALCCIIVGHIAFNEGVDYFFSIQEYKMTGPFIMHLIGLSLLLSAFVKSITQIIFYRRGY